MANIEEIPGSEHVNDCFGEHNTRRNSNILGWAVNFLRMVKPGEMKTIDVSTCSGGS